MNAVAATLAQRVVLALGALVLTGCGATANRDALPEPAQRPAPVVDLLESERPAIPHEPALSTPQSEKAAPTPTTWTLERCINRALTANRGLLDVSAQADAAEYSLIAAESIFELQVVPSANSAFVDSSFDSVGVELGLSRLMRNGTTVSVIPSVRRVEDVFVSGYTATLDQPLLRGRQRELVEDGVDRAKFGIRSSDRALQLAQIDVVLGTIQSLYRVVQERESLTLIQDSVARSDSHLEAARARERAGLSSSLDVFRATQQRNQVQDSFDSSTQAYADAVDTLRLILALPLDVPLEIDAPLQVEDQRLSEREAIALALSRRVEVAQAMDSVSEASRVARVASINTMPDLDLVLSASQVGTSEEFDDSLELGSVLFGVSLGSTTNWRRTSEKAFLAQARLGVESARRALALRRDLVTQDVKRALREVERGRLSIVLQQQQIGQAAGKLEVARKKFDLGLANNFDVIEAEEELRSAQIALIRAITRMISSQFALRAALGTLVEHPN
jgi:outer membrane protein